MAWGWKGRYEDAVDRCRTAERKNEYLEREIQRLNGLLLERSDVAKREVVDIVQGPQDRYLQEAQAPSDPPAGHWSDDGLVWIDDAEEEGDSYRSNPADEVLAPDLIEEYARRLGV